MNKSIKNAAQAGFTLIELIVVIVILGILAATALPKFSSMGNDARAATVQAAKGSVASVSAMVHGKFLINPSATTTVPFEGVSVGVTNGYPSVATSGTSLQTAAGLAEWTLIAAGTAATVNSPATGADEVAFIPASVAGTTSGLNCYVKFKEAAATAGSEPAITTDVTKC